MALATVLAAGNGNIGNIINGIAPNWGPFGSWVSRRRCSSRSSWPRRSCSASASPIWGAAKQRIGATAMRDSFSAEQGKGLIIAGLTGLFIIGSPSTLFTIVYGMAI